MALEVIVPPISHVIQLAVAPVFLLTGIGGMLGVMTNRLSRVVDRTRVLEAQMSEASSASETVRQELKSLFKRAELVSRSITLCTITALLVCAVVALLFLGDFFGVAVRPLVGSLFVLSMGTFFAGLVYFLREIMLATASIELSTQRALQRKR
jgi:Protein of unknown function (DUF2721)